MLTFIFFAFIAYLLFRLVFDFVIPIYRTTKRVKKTFREMHQKMNGQSADAPPHQKKKTDDKKKQPSGDYIDFEEVKD